MNQNPALWRVCSYSAPGLPKPTNNLIMRELSTRHPEAVSVIARSVATWREAIPSTSSAAGSALPPCLHKVGHGRPATRDERLLLCVRNDGSVWTKKSPPKRALKALSTRRLLLAFAFGRCRSRRCCFRGNFFSNGYHADQHRVVFPVNNRFHALGQADVSDVQ